MVFISRINLSTIAEKSNQELKTTAEILKKDHGLEYILQYTIFQDFETMNWFSKINRASIILPLGYILGYFSRNIILRSITPSDWNLLYSIAISIASSLIMFGGTYLVTNLILTFATQNYQNVSLKQDTSLTDKNIWEIYKKAKVYMLKM